MESEHYTYIIVGIIILAAIGLCIFFWYRNRKRVKQESSGNINLEDYAGVAPATRDLDALDKGGLVIYKTELQEYVKNLTRKLDELSNTKDHSGKEANIKKIQEAIDQHNAIVTKIDKKLEEIEKREEGDAALSEILKSLPKEVDVGDLKKASKEDLNRTLNLLKVYTDNTNMILRELALVGDHKDAKALEDKLLKLKEDAKANIVKVELELASRVEKKTNFDNPPAMTREQFFEKYKDYINVEFDKSKSGILQQKFPFGRIGDPRDYPKVYNMERTIYYIPDLAGSFFNWIGTKGSKYLPVIMDEVADKIDPFAMLAKAGPEWLAIYQAEEKAKKEAAKKK